MPLHKVLVIDDSPTVLNILKATLEDEGYSVITAESGPEGIKAVESQIPELVIIDTILPGMDGFEVCSQIRQLKNDTKPQIIMITGNIDAVDAIKARRSGADDYVVKTGDLKLLIDAVQKLLPIKG